jgi:hypothetical protein
LREEKRGFHYLLIAVHIIGMELNLNGLPNNASHLSGFIGEDGGIVKVPI